jgi:hypothetical protein
MGQHLPVKVHIAKLHELIESEVSVLTSWMVDETVWAILKRQRSGVITTVHVMRKMIFDIQLNRY